MMLKNIQKIINYNPEALEEEYKKVHEQYTNDPEYQKLEKQFDKFEITKYIMIFLLMGFCFVEAFRFNFAVLLGCAAIMMPLAIIADQKGDTERYTFYTLYFTNKLEYHKQVYNRNVLACFGELVGDSKFKVTVVTEATNEDKENRVEGLDETTVKRSYLFDYDGSNPEGLLTLDVENNRVSFT